MGFHRLILPALSALALTPNLAFAQPSNLAATVPAAVKLLPVDTAGVILINTHDRAWAELSRFGLFPADFAFPANFFPLNTGINFYTDIQPWLGEHIAIAYLPLTDTDQVSINTSLLIAPITDASKVPAFLAKLKASREDAPLERDYKGITIIEWIAEDTAPKDEEPPTDEEKTSEETVTQATMTTEERAVVRKSVTKIISNVAVFDQKHKINPTKVGDIKTPEKMPAEPAEAPAESPAAMPEELPLKPSVPGLAIAILPNGYLVSASIAKPIEQLIDAQSASQHLLDNPTFKRTIANPNFGRSLVVGYGDYGQIFKAATKFNQEQLKNSPLPLPFPVPSTDPSLTALVQKVYDNIEGYVWVQPEGIRLQMGVGFKYAIPAAMITQMTTPNQIMQRLPATSYVAGNGKDLASIWRLLVTGVELQPKLKPGLANLRKLSQQNTGVDDRDIFPWMNGEYVSFLYGTKQGWIPAAFSDIDLGVGMMFQTSDRPAAEAALKKLDQFVQTHAKPATKVATRQLKGQPITSWEILDDKKRPQSLLSRNWVSADTLMFLTGTTATAELTPQPLQALTQTRNFQAAIAPLPPANTGYFYFNASAALTFINNALLPKIFGKEVANNPFLDYYKEVAGNIRSVSSTSSVVANKYQTDGFLALATTRPKPMSAAELLDLGTTKVEQGEGAGAIANLSRVLQIDANNAKAYYYRGQARHLQSDNLGAIADLSQAIQLDPRNGDAYRLRGKVNNELFDYAKAEKDYTQAIQFQPDQAELYEERSQIRGVLEDAKGAIADANQAIKLAPTSSIAYNSRCYVRARGLGDFKAALADCDKAIVLAQDTPNAGYLPVYLTSRCYVRANLADQTALADCERAIELNPDYIKDPLFLEDRGLAHLALGKRAAALADWQQALEVTPPTDRVSVTRLEKLVKSLQ